MIFCVKLTIVLNWPFSLDLFPIDCVMWRYFLQYMLTIYWYMFGDFHLTLISLKKSTSFYVVILFCLKHIMLQNFIYIKVCFFLYNICWFQLLNSYTIGCCHVLFFSGQNFFFLIYESLPVIRKKYHKLYDNLLVHKILKWN